MLAGILQKDAKQGKKPPIPRDGWQSSYQDPLRWKFHQSQEECFISGTPKVSHCENELCSTKALFMHCPTHEPRRTTSGEYPFSWHLGDKRRNWEIRLQLRFKKIPERLFFGLELANFVPVSGTARAVQKALVSACRKIVGECYHSCGDDPRKTSGECELPSFVMPLWAFDQFAVSDPGKEPDLADDFESVGRRRTDGAKNYIREMNDVIANFSTEKVYTFCFWGVSQFLDCIKWEICGSGFPIRIDFNKLCGRPPVYITMYDLPAVGGQDQRHLASRKRRYFHIATWSGARPASLDSLGVEEPVAVQDDIELPAEDLLQLTKSLEELPDLMSMEDMFGAPAAPAQAQSFDLLGMDFGAPSKDAGYQAAAAPKAPSKQAETVDLLGLF